ncbi:MAG: response regulator [Arachidicoccus sp.]|nr:response regulator [Arachidicoccus sp.]
MKKILLIEDNDDIRNNTAEILELSNYEVFTAENGKAGIEQALKHIPDLIICDVMMPVLDGFGVLHSLQKNKSVKNIPFIFLTAKTERSDIRKGMELGADDYITKPFTGTELLNAVDSRIKKIDALKQEVANGLEGFNNLLKVTHDKNALQDLTLDRDIDKFKKKQIIYTEGNRPNKIFYVMSGKIKTFRTNDDGKELITDLYSAGDFFGYIPLLEKTSYRDTAEALEESEITIIPKEDFDELLNNNWEVSQKFVQLLANNVSTKEEQLLKLAYNSLRKKVADALLLLIKKYKDKNINPFEINISRESLASIAGTATESLIRTLGDFKNEKIIDIKNGNIIVTDEKKLENMHN